MTKPYKATQIWVDMYDVLHTLFFISNILIFSYKLLNGLLYYNHFPKTKKLPFSEKFSFII